MATNHDDFMVIPISVCFAGKALLGAPRGLCHGPGALPPLEGHPVPRVTAFLSSRLCSTGGGSVARALFDCEGFWMGKASPSHTGLLAGFVPFQWITSSHHLPNFLLSSSVSSHLYGLFCTLHTCWKYCAIQLNVLLVHVYQWLLCGLYFPVLNICLTVRSQ